MPTKLAKLPVPTRELLDRYVRKFDDSQPGVERALAKLISQCPENSIFEDVLLKVVTLNDLYRTNVFATYQLAQHIHSLNVDAGIQSGTVETVHRIARMQVGGKTRNNYSFASKYCSWHNPDAYALYDSFVDWMLWGYGQQDRFADFQRRDLLDYQRFMQVIQAFRRYYGFEDVQLKTIDKFLWTAGKDLRSTLNT